MFSRSEIEEAVLQALSNVHQDAINAAKRAHDTATGTESVAENKYDTFGLEASYLAHGQSVRVAECQADLHAYQQLFASLKHKASQGELTDKPLQIANGNLIELIDDDDVVSLLFMGPSAGGLKVCINQRQFMLITALSPIGKALFSRQIEDEISLSIAGKSHHYQVVAIY